MTGSSRPTWPWRGCIRPTCEVRSASFSVPFTVYGMKLCFFQQIWGEMGSKLGEFMDLMICGSVFFFLNVYIYIY